eukprot:GHVN01066224.1.p2 GENE.GHVN01066224.1~~GHVN01066224.1.p2  ORF type:complete len:170 (+),score=1.46 GHVN01066224.1:3661-4170(+)
MSEFSESNNITKLIGAGPGYAGYGEDSNLSKFLIKNKKKPNIILFDEIEKAHSKTSDVLLQALDDGYITTSKGEQLNFSNSFIILTTNLGCNKEDIEFPSIFENMSKIKNSIINNYEKKINSAITKYFRPEILNRINYVVVFKPLTFNCLYGICNKLIKIIYENTLNKY